MIGNIELSGSGLIYIDRFGNIKFEGHSVADMLKKSISAKNGDMDQKFYGDIQIKVTPIKPSLFIDIEEMDSREAYKFWE